MAVSGRARRLAILALLGFSSGLPYLLIGSTLSAWMTRAGVDLGTIGLFALVGLPYSLKLAWAPLLDRFRFPVGGRRRGWIALFQLALAGAIWLLASVDPRGAPLAVAACALAVAFLSANQDIVSDAYRSDLLEPTERGAGAAAFILGYRSAMLVAGGLALILADHLSWRSIYRGMALLMAASVLVTWRAPEPEAARAPSTLREAVLEPLRDYFSRRRALAILGFLTLYRVGEIVAASLVVPFLLQLGFSNSEIGVVAKAVGIAATIAGALGGGLLVSRLGLYRALLIFGLFQAASNLGYAALALAGPRHGLLLVAVGADNLCAGLTIAALESLLLSLCNKRFSATQYALFTSVAGLAGRLVAASAGFVAARAGWPLFFVCTAAAAIPALALLTHLRRDRIV